jgi:L-seryl-tRNA(Ser) seleniumtransferase
MEALKQIPPVNDVLRAPELAEFASSLAEPFAVRLLDQIMDQFRLELGKKTQPVKRSELTAQIASEFARRLREVLKPSMRRVINASGVVLHTNLGRSPLPEAAIDHLREISVGYSNLEFDVETGSRGKRDVHVEKILQQLIHCESAIVVNNNAAAVLLVLNTLAEGGEVIASRGEQVEIGGSFRIPEVMSRSGAKLREVGATNRTNVQDYEKAVNENTRLLLRVHPSNFKMIGFTGRVTLEEFVALGKRCRIPTFEDLGSGYVSAMALPNGDGEPGVIESIRAGVDLVSFSGDKLLGGPQSGIIAGKRLFVEKLRQNPLFRALRVDKLTLSSLEIVLLTYLQGRMDRLPVWKMLHASEAELKQRVDAFVQQAGLSVRPVRLTSLVGAGSAPETHYDSWGIAVEIEGISEVELEKRFRNSEPPVIVRLEDGRVLLDFRTIFPKEEKELFAILRRI